MRQRLIITKQIEEFRRRNAIINGNFDIWQRGKTFGIGASGSPEVPGTGEYTADRWFVNAGIPSGGGMVTREEFDVGQADIPNGPRYYLRYTHNGGDVSTEAPFIYQRIEDYKTFANEVITISFWARGTVGLDFRVTAAQSANGLTSSGSPLSSNALLAGNFSLESTTEWQKYVFTSDISEMDITALVSPTDANHFQVAIATLSTGSPVIQSGDFFDVAQVQVERGTVESNFEYRPFTKELELCQRYYQKSYNLDVDPGTPGEIDIGHPHFYVENDSYCAGVMNFPVTMRVVPSMVIYRPSTGEANLIEDILQTVGSPEPVVDVVRLEGGVNGLTVIVVTDGSLTPRHFYQFHYTADAEL